MNIFVLVQGFLAAFVSLTNSLHFVPLFLENFLASTSISLI